MHIPPAQIALFDFGIVLPMLVVLVVMSILLFFVRQYKRCPSNRILVVYGKVGGSQASRCIHGGGVFVVPLFQDYQYLSLEPLAIEIELTGALSKKNIRVNVPSTFTIGVSTDPAVMNNAAERLLGLGEPEIAAQARDIILGQMRLVIATLSIEEINQDREKFLDLVNKFCSSELFKIGLEVINVNIRDITDESGYIDAIGKKAAAEAIQTALVEVAEQEKDGAIGEASANRERAVEVANQESAAAIGRKQAEREQRIRVAKLEAEGVAGEAEGAREQDIAKAQQAAITVEAPNRPRPISASASPPSKRKRSRGRTSRKPPSPTTTQRCRNAERKLAAAARLLPPRPPATSCKPRKNKNSPAYRKKRLSNRRSIVNGSKSRPRPKRRSAVASPEAKPMPCWRSTTPKPRASNACWKPRPRATRICCGSAPNGPIWRQPCWSSRSCRNSSPNKSRRSRTSRSTRSRSGTRVRAATARTAPRRTS